MTADMFLKVDGLDHNSIFKKRTKEIDLFWRNRGASRLTSVTMANVHCSHPRPAEPCERLARKRVTMFALEVAVGVAACAGTILAIFAWGTASI
jgi:hypothetical protein